MAAGKNVEALLERHSDVLTDLIHADCVQITRGSRTLHINVDGVCLLRIGSAETIEFDNKTGRR